MLHVTLSCKRERVPWVLRTRLERREGAGAEWIAVNQREAQEALRRMLLMMDRHGVSQNRLSRLLYVNQTAISSWKLRPGRFNAAYLLRFPRAFANLTGIHIEGRWLMTGQGPEYRNTGGDSGRELNAERSAWYHVMEYAERQVRRVEGQIGLRPVDWPDDDTMNPDRPPRSRSC